MLAPTHAPPAPHTHPDGAFVIINDPTVTAFSPKAPVYMRAYSWSCSYCVFGQVYNGIHPHSFPRSPGNLLFLPSLHHCFFKNITVGDTQCIGSLFIVTSFTYWWATTIHLLELSTFGTYTLRLEKTWCSGHLWEYEIDSHFGRQFGSFLQK